MAHTILLIDDDKDFVEVVVESLKQEDYTLCTAHTPAKGWKQMETYNPDIMLIDWEMPNLSGIDLIKRIKREPAHRERYIIMVTGKRGTENIVQGLDAGADDFLEKPFAIDELLARIRSGLRIRALEKRISDDMKLKTVLEMAMSVADKIGNPIAAAKLQQQLLMDTVPIKQNPAALESLITLGHMLDEVLSLINKFQTLKDPKSIPAPGGKSMISPE